MSDQNNYNHLSDDDKAKLLDHDYDGIQELDHPLPQWWIATFVISVLFSIPYFYYYVLGGGPSLSQEHEMQMVEVTKIKEAAKSQGQKFSMDEYNALASDEGVKQGQQIFVDNCVACHKEQGIGDIGPNLTDAYWIEGTGSVEDLFKTVFNGREEKGMPVWGEILSKEEIYKAVSYVRSLRNKNLPGKDPQGELVND